MIYITGDTHGDFSRFKSFCRTKATTTDDIMIILGDAGLNYWCDYHDMSTKEIVAQLPITFFCIHGNHEERPSNICTYRTKEFHGGMVWYEDAYPNILFARDGDIFQFGNHNCVVIGGAYSIDKPYRLRNGWKWFKDEQPSELTKIYVEDQLIDYRDDVDVVLSHTCPYKYEPTEMFLQGIDQSKVDKSTEHWLDALEGWIYYKKWYCGHYHTDKKIDRMRFMYTDIEPFGCQLSA